MIVYTKHCLPCTHKTELKALKRFAAENKLELEVRQVAYDKQWQKEASNLAKYHKVEYPFVHHGGKAIHISDDYGLLIQSEQASEVNNE